MKTKVFFVSCFEASGDAIGAHLVRSLRLEFGEQTRFVGIAGPLMQAEGVQSLVDYERLNIMGILPVLMAAPRLLRPIKELAKQIDELQPDAIVTIDAPDFHIRLMKKMRSHNCPRTQLVSPSVWAWRTGRARHFAAVFDVMYCIFPFEAKCYADLPIRTLYVGHPSVKIAKDDQISEDAFRQRYSAAKNVTLLLGSRKGELQRLGNDFLQIIQRLEHASSIHFIIPTLPQHVEVVERLFAQVSQVSIVTEPQWRFAAMRYSDAALCCMGTVELELSLRNCPHIALYRFKWFDNILRKLLRFSIQHGALSNILMQSEVIPEYIQQKIDHDQITAQIMQITDKNTAGYANQTRAMHGIQSMLAKADGDFAAILSADMQKMLNAD